MITVEAILIAVTMPTLFFAARYFTNFFYGRWHWGYVLLCGVFEAMGATELAFYFLKLY